MTELDYIADDAGIIEAAHGDDPSRYRAIRLMLLRLIHVTAIEAAHPHPNDPQAAWDARRWLKADDPHPPTDGYGITLRWAYDCVVALGSSLPAFQELQFMLLTSRIPQGRARPS